MDFEEWYKSKYFGVNDSFKQHIYAAWQESRVQCVAYIHDDIIDGCKTVEDCNQEIINYSIRLTQKD